MHYYHPVEQGGRVELTQKVEPTEQYWAECEQRLKQQVSCQEQPWAFMDTLCTVRKFLANISNECGDKVRHVTLYEQSMMAICIATKLIFGTPIMSNLDIPHFLCHSYSPGPKVRE